MSLRVGLRVYSLDPLLLALSFLCVVEAVVSQRLVLAAVPSCPGALQTLES